MNCILKLSNFDFNVEYDIYSNFMVFIFKI